MVIDLIVLLGLLVCSWTDLRERKIYISVIALDTALLFAAQIFGGSFSSVVAASGFCIGIMFLFLYILTGGQIGAGDALLFAVVAFAKQGIGLVYCILFTFILLFGTAILLMAFKRAGMKTQLPVAPFLLVSYALMCWVKP